MTITYYFKTLYIFTIHVVMRVSGVLGPCRSDGVFRLLCVPSSTSLPGGNQVDGLPPAASAGTRPWVGVNVPGHAAGSRGP